MSETMNVPDNDDANYEKWLQNSEQKEQSKIVDESTAQLKNEIHLEQKKSAKNDAQGIDHIGRDFPNKKDLDDDAIGQAEQIVHKKMLEEKLSNPNNQINPKKVLDIRHMAGQGYIGNEEKLDSLKNIGEFEKEEVNNN